MRLRTKTIVWDEKGHDVSGYCSVFVGCFPDVNISVPNGEAFATMRQAEQFARQILKAVAYRREWLKIARKGRAKARKPDGGAPGQGKS